jgi:hypothetical protein
MNSGSDIKLLAFYSSKNVADLIEIAVPLDNKIQKSQKSEQIYESLLKH